MIKSIFDPGNYPQKVDFALLILRVAIGIFMLTHGMGKLYKLFGNDPISFADPIGIGATASLALAVFAEVFCSVLLILGLATRLAAVPLIFTMFVAGFIVHAGDEFRVKEMAFLYLVVYIAIALKGAGKFSLDALIFNKMKPAKK
ncbi:MAG TPA: DoxX family protein [Bacteroidales bacterium]